MDINIETNVVQFKSRLKIIEEHNEELQKRYAEFLSGLKDIPIEDESTPDFFFESICSVYEHELYSAPHANSNEP